jgi:nucleotide-binding universal stress UspA family protein
MFKKILIPVDGSDLALKAASTAVKLAKEVSAEVVFLHSMAPYIAPYAADVALMDSKTQAMFEKNIADDSAQILSNASKIADAADVVCQSVSAVSSRPEVLIESTVKEKGCDLIVLATHGRGAIGRFVMGSVTTRLLPISPVPVLIYRDATMTDDGV